MTTSATATDSLRGGQQALARERGLRRTIFAPPSHLSVSEWADRYRRLSAGSPEEGRWRTARTPYLREIMDGISDPAVERIVVQKAARVGYTEGVVGNAVGYWIDQEPSQIMILQPTVDDAKGWSKEQLDPMLADTPRLTGKVTDSGRRDKKNGLQFKRFPGGFIVIVGANAASGLRRRNIQNLLADEIDGYPTSAKSNSGKVSEGDPISLAQKRTENYPRRKIVLGSTPTIKGESRIEAEFQASDRRYWHVPCPHCGLEQRWRWRNIHWENHDARTAHYVCGAWNDQDQLIAGCGAVIAEDQKPWMSARGRWIAENPGAPTRGYFVGPAIMSLLTSWSRLVGEFLAAKGDREKTKAFVTQVLGETWEEDGEQLDHSALIARRENYPGEVPLGIAVLIAGVDIQGDRLEVSVWGFGPEERRALIRHEVLWGDPGQPEVWNQLDLVRQRRWQHALGIEVRIMATGLDTGGHHTDRAYRYAKARSRERVFAMRGSPTPGSAPVSMPSKKNRERVFLFTIGTEAIKDGLFSALRIQSVGPGYVQFPMVQEEYFRQLTAEVRKVKFIKGKGVPFYEKRYDRNEALDCFVYAQAALLALGPVREQLGRMYQRLKARVAAANPGPGAPAAPPTSDAPDEPDPSRPTPPKAKPLYPARGSSWATRW